MSLLNNDPDSFNEIYHICQQFQPSWCASSANTLKREEIKNLFYKCTATANRATIYKGSIRKHGRDH
jgi:hypothetical protein